MTRIRRGRKGRKSRSRHPAEREDYASLLARPEASGLPFTLDDDAQTETPPPAPTDAAPSASADTVVPEADPAEPDPLTDPTDEELLLNAGRVAAMRGEIARAISIYRELIASNAAHAPARHALALLLEQHGNPEGALDQLDICVELDPDNVRYRTARGAVLSGMRRFREALDDLRTSLTMDASSVDAHFHLGILMSRKGLWAEAQPFLRRSVELDPGCGAAYAHLGDVLNHLDDLNGALQAYQRATELGPTDARALYGLGVVYDRLNQPEEAAIMYRRSRELAGT